MNTYLSLYVSVVLYCVFVSGDIFYLKGSKISDKTGDLARKAVKRTVDQDPAGSQPTSSSYARYQEAISDNHLSQEEIESFRQTPSAQAETSTPPPNPQNQCRFNHYVCEIQELVGRCELFGQIGVPGCRAGEWTDLRNRDCRNLYVQRLAERQQQSNPEHND